jgi:hypothetical protein
MIKTKKIYFLILIILAMSFIITPINAQDVHIYNTLDKNMIYSVDDLNNPLIVNIDPHLGGYTYFYESLNSLIGDLHVIKIIYSEQGFVSSSGSFTSDTQAAAPTTPCNYTFSYKYNGITFYYHWTIKDNENPEVADYSIRTNSKTPKIKFDKNIAYVSGLFDYANYGIYNNQRELELTSYNKEVNNLGLYVHFGDGRGQQLLLTISDKVPGYNTHRVSFIHDGVCFPTRSIWTITDLATGWTKTIRQDTKGEKDIVFPPDSSHLHPFLVTLAYDSNIVGIYPGSISAVVSMWDEELIFRSKYYYEWRKINFHMKLNYLCIDTTGYRSKSGEVDTDITI